MAFWRDKLGLALDHIEAVPSQDVEVAFLPIGDSEVELVKPTSDETGLAKIHKQRGTGLHHLCLQVDDIQGILMKLQEGGVRLINKEPIAYLGVKWRLFTQPAPNGVW